ncbi:hypothetical protein SERLA73DRAFT_119839 [Serpula lacrymans var. lacrymans S7.3]|uniref:Uncharacterized protein n=2 Tax=Serpula lacrymans var. lacrymans TaxID=341189 RepID=F8PMH6_SERL3|nr:uncharacterized protein SERLADRAFT_366213 [Serpula lacrymans var. lacrymans S7.9]EGO02808.1 hypothetical protein SERLA73DRAFT_119839 [Serpula lacrymans var. lacrymans S7.3]EGO28510.1 hypothetical protein SERLADRAFT_366213 [Serpula lacrymans var. lacrymans S7.9]
MDRDQRGYILEQEPCQKGEEHVKLSRSRTFKVKNVRFDTGSAGSASWYSMLCLIYQSSIIYFPDYITRKPCAAGYMNQLEFLK